MKQQYGEGNYIPPVKTTFWSFRIMAGLGGVLILLSLFGLYWNWRGTLASKSTYLKIMVATIFFPFIANSAGWIMSEIGRQPWIVNGLMKTADRRFSKCISRYRSYFHLVAFSLVYTLLAIAMVKLFLKVIKEGPYRKTKRGHQYDRSI